MPSIAAAAAMTADMISTRAAAFDGPSATTRIYTRLTDVTHFRARPQKWRACRNSAVRSPWSIGLRIPTNPILGGGPPALARRGSAFEGQSAVGGPTPVRDP